MNEELEDSQESLQTINVCSNMSCLSRIANSQLLYQLKWLPIINAHIQLETRNSPPSLFSGNKVLQAALHEEQRAL